MVLQSWKSHCKISKVEKSWHSLGPEGKTDGWSVVSMCGMT